MTTISSPPDSLVCGVDDSSHAAAVVVLAADLAARLGLRLRLVHSPSTDVYLVGQPRRAALNRGASLLASFGAQSDDDHIVEIGDPTDVLAAVISEDAALAVVGSRGRGPTRAAVLGSVSSALAHRSPCPLVVVPPGAQVQLAAAPAIVCGLDGSTAAVRALRSAAALARALDGHLVALHVRNSALTMGMPSVAGHRQPFVEPLDTARAAIAVVEQPLAELDPDVRTVMRIESGNAAQCLARVAADAGHAIIVVGSHGRGPLRSALLGSVSLRLAATAPVPVMIVPPTAAAISDRFLQNTAFAAPALRTR
jgi:nucleotide-binding universal stress UspA family protein